MRRAVRAIIIRDGKLLIMRRDKFGQPPYYTLPGGGIDPGETAEQALKRELIEECQFTITTCKHVLTEEAGDPFGTQYIFECQAIGDKPRLHPDSEEAQIQKLGENLHDPQWMALSHLHTVLFRSEELKHAILHGAKHGFPETPHQLDIRYVRHLKEKM